MDPRYESLLAELDRLRSTAKAAGDANGGMVKSMERLKLEEELRIKQLSKATGVSEKELAAREKVAKAADEAAMSETKRTQAAEKAAKDAEMRQQERDKKQTEAILKAVGNIKGLGSQALNVTAGMYGTTQVFESAIPTLKLLGDTTKAVVSAIAAMGSAIPFIGGLFTAADKALGALTSMAVAVASLELQMAQKYYDSYQQVNKAGVGFGGSIGGLVSFLNDSQVSLGTFSRFVAASRDDLIAFGGGLELASRQVLTMGKGVAAANPKLLILMGGLDGLYGGIADYGAALARVGVDLAKQPELMKKGLTDYLYTLKEVETLTGMSVEQQKKSNEARSVEILFQKRSQEIMAADPVKGAATMLKINSVINGLEATFGKDSPAIKFVKESFGNQGQLTNAANIGFAAIAPDLTAGLNETLNTVLSGGSVTDALKVFAKVAAEQGNKLGSGPMNTLASVFGANPDMQGSFRDVLQTLAVLGSKKVTLQKLLDAAAATANQRGAGPDELTTKTAAALIALEQNQITMDKHVAENLGKMGDLAKTLTDLNTKLIKEFGPMITTSIEYMDKMIEKLIGEAFPAVRAERERQAELAHTQARTAVLSRAGPRGRQSSAVIAEANAAGDTARQRYLQQNSMSSVRAQMERTNPGSSSGGTGDSTTVEGLMAAGLKVNLNALDKDKKDPNAPYGKINPEFAKKLLLLAQLSHIPEVTSLFREGDGAHGGPNGAQAADFGVGNTSPEMIAKLIHTMKNASGIPKLQFEDSTPSALLKNVDGLLRSLYGITNGTHVNEKSTAPHIHMAQYKYGGITNGPSIAGEDPSNPHEAVIPLPDGRTIPVKIDLSSLTDAIYELIAINKDQLDMQNRIVQVSA